MGQFDSLIPGNTATSVKAAPNQFASLIPAKTTPTPVSQGTPVGQFLAQIPEAASAGFSQATEGMSTILNPKGATPAQGAEAALKVGSGITTTLFSPIAPLTNLIGKAIDFAGNQLARVPAVQQFAQTSTPTDTRVLEALQNLGGIAMGILGAKAGDLKTIPPAKLAEIAQHPDVIAAAQQLGEAQKAVPPEAQAPLNEVIKQSMAEYSKSQGYEPIVPDSQLPTIEAGPAAKSTLPTIQMKPSVTNKLGDLTVEPIKKGQFDNLIPQPKAPVAPKIEPTAIDSLKPQEAAPSELQTLSSPETPTEASGGAKVQKMGEITKVASDINASLIKQGFESLPSEEQSHYTPESYKIIEKNVSNLLENNLDEAKAMASGELPISKTLHGHGQILFNTVEALATKEEDGELLAKLAASPLGKVRSIHAQGLGESGYNANPNSAVKAIQEVQSARDATLKAKGIDQTKETATDTNTFKSETKAARSPRQSWEDFTKQITCNI